MAIERWDPFRDHAIHARGDGSPVPRLVGASAGFASARLGGRHPCGCRRRRSNEFVVRATIPGVRPEDIQVNRAGRPADVASGEPQRAGAQRRALCPSRALRLLRSIAALALPSPVNTDQADASYDQGVLTLTLPKTQVEKSSQIRVHSGEQPAGQLESGSSTASGNA